MDVIAGRKTVGRIEGDIFVNGKPKDQNTWARCTGYVEQVRPRALMCDNHARSFHDSSSPLMAASSAWLPPLQPLNCSCLLCNP
jgi:hypothetical protein